MGGLAKKTEVCNRNAKSIPSEMKSIGASGFWSRAIAECALGDLVVWWLCASCATTRQCRLPEALSTTAVSGCRSSVREMTGNRSARAQIIAPTSMVMLFRGFRRDTDQRNRHSQIVASVIPSQTRFRLVSIAWCRRGHRISPELHPARRWVEIKGSRENKSSLHPRANVRNFAFEECVCRTVIRAYPV